MTSCNKDPYYKEIGIADFGDGMIFIFVYLPDLNKNNAKRVCELYYKKYSDKPKTVLTINFYENDLPKEKQGANLPKGEKCIKSQVLIDGKNTILVWNIEINGLE